MELNNLRRFACLNFFSQNVDLERFCPTNYNLLRIVTQLSLLSGS